MPGFGGGVGGQPDPAEASWGKKDSSFGAPNCPVRCWTQFCRALSEGRVNLNKRFRLAAIWISITQTFGTTAAPVGDLEKFGNFQNEHF